MCDQSNQSDHNDSPSDDPSNDPSDDPSEQSDREKAREAEMKRRRSRGFARRAPKSKFKKEADTEEEEESLILSDSLETDSEEGEGRSKSRRGRPKSARHKAMDFLARRGYSEQELRLKLSRDYADDDVEDAITHCRENNWLSAPEEIAERVAVELSRKNKGHRFINQFLKSKGLPPVEKDLDAEVEKAKGIIASKLRHDFETDGPLPFESKAKAQRLLMNRGFDVETIRKVLR